jgi:hypothetical protein
MKLFFSKDENNEVVVKLQKGTVQDDFSYTEMVRQLLENNKFEDTDFGNLSTEEQGKIQTMLDKTSSVFEVDSDALNDHDTVTSN